MRVRLSYVDRASPGGVVGAGLKEEGLQVAAKKGRSTQDTNLQKEPGEQKNMVPQPQKAVCEAEALGVQADSSRHLTREAAWAQWDRIIFSTGPGKSQKMSSEWSTKPNIPQAPSLTLDAVRTQ